METTSFFKILTGLLAALCFGLDVHAEGGEADKKLYEAVQYQDTLKIKELLASGANPNSKENGRPLLGWAAQAGNVEVVELLLNAKVNVNVADDGIGHTPLMRAIDTQQVAVANALLKAKADPNAKTPDGKTCLDMAVESRKAELVRALLEAGADPKHVAADGGSPALIAAQDGSPESIEIIRILGKAGANLNSSNAAYTPLTYAIEQGNKALVQALLEAGADPNGRAEGGRAPIHLALDNKEILELLIKAKANPNLETGSGETPLFAAIESGNKDAVEQLLKAGADASKANASGTSPLDYATQNSQTEIAELLKPKTPQASPDENKELAQVPASAGSKDCTIADAARKQMELHGKLQAQVDAGKMNSDIFRTFNEDTKDYANMLATNPAEACKLFERLKVKYGV